MPRLLFIYSFMDKILLNWKRLKLAGERFDVERLKESY